MREAGEGGGLRARLVLQPRAAPAMWEGRPGVGVLLVFVSFLLSLAASADLTPLFLTTVSPPGLAPFSLLQYTGGQRLPTPTTSSYLGPRHSLAPRRLRGCPFLAAS